MGRASRGLLATLRWLRSALLAVFVLKGFVEPCQCTDIYSNEFPFFGIYFSKQRIEIRRKMLFIITIERDLEIDRVG